MRLNTLVTLGASATFGIMAVVLARGWINDAVRSEISVVPLVTSDGDLIQTTGVPVVIADANFAFGDELTPQALRVVMYPEDAVPVGAYTSLDNVFVDGSERTLVLSRMDLNEPILDYKISGPGGRGSLSLLIKEGMRAVSVRMNDVDGVAGFVLPGDHIDVIYTRDEALDQNKVDYKSDVILQHVKVLGINQDMTTDDSAPRIANTVTLEVTTEDAQKLNIASDNGRLSLTLRRAGEIEIDPTRTVGLKNLKQRSPQRPFVRKTRKTLPKQADVSGTASVTIIRGDERDEVNVVSEADTSVTSELAGG